MIFPKLLIALSVMNTALAAAVVTGPQPLAVAFPPGSASIVQTPNGDTRVYHQKPDGSIWQVAASGPFLKPTFESDILIVPADEVLPGTPIAATSVDGAFADVHIYFFSPKLVVSEYIWTNGIGFQGGPNCALCLTASGFVAASGQYLYAAENTAAGAPSTLRVGFNGAGAPGSLTEANKVAGVWQLGVMN